MEEEEEEQEQESAPAVVVGTIFRPTDRQLIESYLRRKIAGDLHNSAASFFREADVYAAAPFDLCAQYAPAPGTCGDGGDHGVWYFFHNFSSSPAVGYASGASRSRRQAGRRLVGGGSGPYRRTRRSRTVAGGTDGKGRWRTEAGWKEVQGSAGGYTSKLSYTERRPASSGSGTTATEQTGRWLMTEYAVEGCDTVIAKIYRSPRHPATSTWSLQELERILLSDDPSSA